MGGVIGWAQVWTGTGKTMQERGNGKQEIRNQNNCLSSTTEQF